jgi:hypothetical protein
LPSSENAAFSGDTRNAENAASDMRGVDSVEDPANFSKVALISDSPRLDFVNNRLNNWLSMKKLKNLLRFLHKISESFEI